MLFSYQALVLAALAMDGVVASPAHRHQHQHVHKRGLRDVLKRDDPSDPNFWNNPSFYQDINWSTVFPSATPTPANGGGDGKAAVQPSPQETSQPPAPPKTESQPESKPESKPSSGSSSGGSGSCIDISVVWSKGDTSGKSGPTAADVGGNGWTDASTSSASKEKRATAEQDGAQGNTGGSQYGRNMVPLSDCNDDSHEYTIKFTNNYADGHDMSVALWNKNGANGQAQSGAFVNAFFMFDLPKGKSAAFAFEPQSMIAFSELSDICQRGGMANGIECVWGEANFEPPSTGGASWSGWDISMVYDPSSQADLSLSNGTPAGTSSKQSCGFTNGGQQFAGEGTSGQGSCNPNQPIGQPLHLTATFGGS